MSLDVLLLEKLAKWRPASGKAMVEASSDAWTAAVAAECVDIVGCRLWELSLRNPQTGAASELNRRATQLMKEEGLDVPSCSAELQLKARAEQVCQRVTGLLEPLRLVEVDAPGNTALLRSEQPGQLGDQRFYYEVLLRGDGGSVVRRYQAPNARQRRQQVAFTITHEALAKLVRDLQTID